MQNIREKEAALLNAGIEVKTKANGHFYADFQMDNEYIEVDEETRNNTIFIAHAIRFEGLTYTKRTRLSEKDFWAMAGEFVADHVDKDKLLDKYRELIKKHDLNYNEIIFFEQYIAEQFGAILLKVRFEHMK